jgi:hypothetical protein
MENTAVSTDVLKGGEFLIRESQPADIFIPEEFTEEQKMIQQMTADFIKNELDPVRDRIEKQEAGVVPGRSYAHRIWWHGTRYQYQYYYS